MSGTAAAMTFSIVPREVLGGAGRTAPSDRITLAGIGVGGVGHGQLRSCDEQGGKIVALCDVDDNYAARSFNMWPQARRYRDYRKMLDSEKDIDAFIQQEYLPEKLQNQRYYLPTDRGYEKTIKQRLEKWFDLKGKIKNKGEK